MNIFILTFHKHDKAFASDLYLIYNRSPAARVCKSDTDRLLMLYLVRIVDHLSQKLKSSGVVDRMHDRLKDYLHQRFQRVLVDGSVSD
jgi:hypothetical protein